jgi:predicted DNA-binding transcriptional regulator AlpA
LTIDQIAEKHGVSRSSVHTYRRGGTFPRPVPVEGTTRVLFDADEVAAWFEANPKQQGRRTDLRSKKPKQGEPVPTTVDPRIAILSALNDPPYNEVAEKRCVPWDDAVKLLHAYRAAVLREAAQHLYTALFPAVYDDMGQKAAEGVNRAVSELRRMTDEQPQDEEA